MLLLLACAAPPAAPTPAPVAAPSQPETVFVQASTLNLREAPAADAKKLGGITMNSPVRVVTAEGEWTRVRTANEKEGWVQTRFLASDPIPLDGARARAAAATDPAERLSWAQRAAAIAPDDAGVLRALADAYRASGDLENAGKVEARAAWPAILPVIQPSDTAIEVELKVGDSQLAEKPVAPEQWATEGIDPAWTWWVLPDRGAAVPAKAGAARWAYSNECGGTASLRLALTASLPPGAVAIAAMHEAPPLSWRVDAPPVDRASMRAHLAKEAGAHEGLRISIAPVADGWHGRAVWEGTPTADEELFPPAPGVDVLFSPDGAVRSTRRDAYSGVAPELPLAERDLDGDGRAEVVTENECQTRITTSDGALLKETDFRCCGC